MTVLGLLTASALVVTAPAWAVGGKSGATCTITNKDSGASYASLQFAVSNAASGDTITIRGTCHSNVAIWSGRISLVGRGGATLDGGGQGSVLSIYGSTVTVTNLTITNGSQTNGGGIYNMGTLSLKGSSVSSNAVTGYGGGIYNVGTVTLAHSKVTGNSATVDGGGIYNVGTLNLGGGTKVTGNQPTDISTAP